MSSWEKFRLLMWKNWTLERRKPISFLFQLAIPVLLLTCPYFIRDNIEKTVQAEKIYDKVQIPEDDRFDNVICGYAPNNSAIYEIVTSLFPSARGFSNFKDLEDYLTAVNSSVNDDDIVGIQFNGNIPDESIPEDISISLRFGSYSKNWYTEFLYAGADISWTRHDFSSDTGEAPYYARRFVPIMYQLTNKILEKSGRTKRLPDIYLQRFPYPEFVSDDALFSLNSAMLLQLIYMFGFMYCFINIVKSVTYEKEKQLKETMKVMGLPTWLHWAAWYCKVMIPFVFIIIYAVIVMKYETTNGKLIQFTDTSLLFIFLFLYVSAITTMAFALSTIFTKANRASMVSGVLWTFSIIPYMKIRGVNIQYSGRLAKYLSSLCLNPAMSFGVDVITTTESTMKGIHWGNLFEKNEQINMSFGEVLMILLVDCVLYMLIALYIETVFPGEFGVPQKWYFFLTKSFWCYEPMEEEELLLGRNNTDFFEDDPSNLRPGIQIKNLGKTYGANDAVKRISMNMYEDQITVLLGHNGAGKTTTMSMLCGMFPPSRGTALVNGYDIRTDIMSVRDSMGICPQHNVLFDELTVREHLIFFSRLKGCTGPEVEEEVSKFLTLLSLEDKANNKSATLSGGMKRKLCVGIALCGKSKIIMLDEPTAGMDPTARRFIWEFLQQQKKGRTILLTTHHMDEADLLGDRIAIMSGGLLQCCGSSFFLKKKYGTGYHLVIDQMPNCNPNDITKLLRKYIPDIEIESNAGTELTYLLPESHASQFQHLLGDLEKDMNALGVRSFGISLTDLEEVFMKVGTSQTGRPLPKSRDTNETTNGTNIQIGISSMETGNTLLINQSLAMLMKKYLMTKRSWGFELMKIAVIIGAIYFCMPPKQLETGSFDMSKRDFLLSQYSDPVTLVQPSGGLEKHYLDLMKELNQKVELSPNLTSKIIELTKDSPYVMKFHYIVGASFENNKAVAWFNGEPYHTVPLAVQLLLQLSYKDIMGPKYNLKFVNAPLPRKATEGEQIIVNVLMGNVMILCLSFIVAFITAFYVMFDIRERVSQAKHLQLISGMNVFVFHAVSFLWDYSTYLLSCVVILITFIVEKPNGFSSVMELTVLTIFLLCLGVAAIPFIYLLSYLFVVPSTGYMRLLYLGFFSGFPCVITITILKAIKWKHTNLVTWILRIFPHFDFTQSTHELMSNGMCRDLFKECLKHSPRDQCEEMFCDMGCCGDAFGFISSGVGNETLMLFVVAVVTILLIILIDLNVINLDFIKFRTLPTPVENVDPDVEAENVLVSTHTVQGMASEYALILKNLTKYYRCFKAVNGINLAVKRSECFGLLGVNGAGKTTTFKMMTGDESISSGDGWINGFSIKNQTDKVHKHIGYCPQFDALLDNLTARETLKMFSLIRGVPRDECNYMAEKLAREFDFTQYLDKEIRELSGGNKRKVSTSVALIGDAPIIFLDEPTTGMDPATKRHLWNNLTKIRESGKSIILTSHSMEECQALCTRLAIMVNGNFRCLGSTQHLKSKFAEGFAVTLKIKKPEQSRGLEHADTSRIERFMAEKFPTSELREKHQELLKYYIKDHNLSWSKLFGILEGAKRELDIEDYSVSQASLEQVFLTFTKEQVADEVTIQKGNFLWNCFQ